jgi:hypothetical protein
MGRPVRQSDNKLPTPASRFIECKFLLPEFVHFPENLSDGRWLDSGFSGGTYAVQLGAIVQIYSAQDHRILASLDQADGGIQIADLRGDLPPLFRGSAL